MEYFDPDKFGTDDIRHRWAMDLDGKVRMLSDLLILNRRDRPQECGCLGGSWVVKVNSEVACTPNLFPLNDQQIIDKSRATFSAALSSVRHDESYKDTVRRSARIAYEAVHHSDNRPLWIAPSVEEIGKFAYAKVPEHKHDVKRRIRAKFGKVIGRITELKPGELSELQNAVFPRIWPVTYASAESIEVLRGEDVIKAYKAGPKSCMSGGEYLHLYADNPEIVGLIVYSTHANWLRPEARAVLWKFEHKGKEMHVVDRVYPNGGTVNAAIRAWAKKRGYLIRKDDGAEFPGFCDCKGVVRKGHLEVTLKWPRTNKAPYMDSFRSLKRASKKEGILTLSTDGKGALARLTSQRGGPLDNLSECPHCNLVGELTVNVTKSDGTRERVCNSCRDGLTLGCSLCGDRHYVADMVDLPDGLGKACRRKLAEYEYAECGCGKVVKSDKTLFVSDVGTELCLDCRTKRGVEECNECGRHFERHTEFGGGHLCASCLEETTFVCTRCNLQLPNRFESTAECTCVDCHDDEPGTKTEEHAFFSTSIFN